MGEVKQKIGIGLLIALILALIYFLYNYFIRNPKSVTIDLANVKADANYTAEFDNRNLNFASDSTKFIRSSFLTTFDGTNTVEAPAKSIYPLTLLKNYKSDGPVFVQKGRPENIKIIKNLWANYSKIITQAATDNRLPKHIILGIVACEHKMGVPLEKAEQWNGFNGEHKTIYRESSTGKSHKGLSQISISQTRDSLTRYKDRGWIKPEQIKFFEQKGLVKSISVKHLFDPAININAAAVTLSGLAHKFGYTNIHRWIFSYNQGEGRLGQEGKNNLSMDETINYFINTKYKEGAEYLLKMFGPHGACDIICNDLGIID